MKVEGDQPPKNEADEHTLSTSPIEDDSEMPNNAAYTSAILVIAPKRDRPAWLQANLEQQCTALARKFMEPCYNAKHHRQETFASAFLLELLRVKHQPTEYDKFRLEHQLGLMDILAKLRQKAYITEEFAKNSSIQMILRQVGDPRWGFSAVARVFALGLSARFERQNWGKKPIVSATAKRSFKQQGKRKRSEPSEETVEVKEKKTKVDQIHIQTSTPDMNDPIFGIDGPMRGTLIKYNTSDAQNITKSIARNTKISQVNSKVYGHNGIAIGTIFFRQMAALAQGAHGSSQAGISGTVEDGAYSVIVTGYYNSLEIDGLDRFEYCATGSMDNVFKDNLIESQGLKTMRTSLTTKNPVRVLRGENKNFTYAPKFGLRYDGLYVVVAERHKHNPKGGLYAVFVLERKKEQGPVVLDRPNDEDMELYKEFKKRLE